MTPNHEYIPYLFHIVPVFRIPSIQHTGQYLGSMESQMLTYFDDLLCVGFLFTLNLMTPNNRYTPYLFHIIPVFGIPSIPNTDQYLGSMESQILTYFDDLLCVGFLFTLNLMTPNNRYTPYLFHIIPVFGIPSIPNTDQYLGSMESQILT